MLYQQQAYIGPIWAIYVGLPRWASQNSAYILAYAWLFVKNRHNQVSIGMETIICTSAIWSDLFLGTYFIVPRLFEEKRRDIIFGIPSFRPSFRPPNIVGTLCAQLLLQFYADSFETLQMF